MWNNFKDGFQVGLGCACAVLFVKCAVAIVRDLGEYFGVLERIENKITELENGDA